MIYPQSNKFLGEVPAGKIVLNNSSIDHAKLKKEIRILCMDNLPKHGIPVKIDFVDALAISPTGKIKR